MGQEAAQVEANRSVWEFPVQRMLAILAVPQSNSTTLVTGFKYDTKWQEVGSS